MSENKNNKKSNISNILLNLSVLLVVVFGIYFIIIRTNYFQSQNNKNNIADVIISPVSAQELYPIFTCPCCGKNLDANCCGMSKERRLYIEALAQGNLTKDGAIMAYIKKYGLDSFVSENQKQEFQQKLIKDAPSNHPIISIESKSYDFGNVSQAKGKVYTLFKLVNTGKGDLVINKLDTSCGCTSASIVYNGKEGPIFSMDMNGKNKKNPKNWQITIPAGEEAQLKVYYDPLVHKKLRGAVVREIYVFSNDPINFETKVKIELNQTD